MLHVLSVWTAIPRSSATGQLRAAQKYAVWQGRILAGAREQDRPVFGTAIAPSTAGQRKMIETAQSMGVRSRVVFPRTFAASNAPWNFGALIFFGAAEAPVGEKQSRQCITLLRGIAASFIDRWAGLIQSNRFANTVLTDVERHLLECVRERISAQAAATRFSLGTTSVHNHYRRINEKLGVRDKRRALAAACALGLIAAERPAGGV